MRIAGALSSAAADIPTAASTAAAAITVVVNHLCAKESFKIQPSVQT